MFVIQEVPTLLCFQLIGFLCTFLENDSNAYIYTRLNWNEYSHDDIIKWKHFPRYWPFVLGIHRSPVNSPHKGQWRGALMFSLMYTSINNSVNNGEAGDLRRHRAHYDVTVMSMCISSLPYSVLGGGPGRDAPRYLHSLWSIQKQHSHMCAQTAQVHTGCYACLSHCQFYILTK